ncbi:MAG: sugar transferase [Flavobacteriales bacterium]|nr:sugar transferase [Flavobacteriales bacterium]
MMGRRAQTARHILADWLAAFLSWGLFFAYRKINIESRKFGEPQAIEITDTLIVGLVVIPVLWLGLYALWGSYRDVYRKSRLQELGHTLVTTLIGVTILFFALILDDEILNHTTYYESFGVLFALHFGLTFLFRFILYTITARKIQRREIGFPTLMVGSDVKAMELFDELETQALSYGNRFVGFVPVKKRDTYPLLDRLPCMGSLTDLKDIIRSEGTEEVIIALESGEHKELERILSKLEGVDVIVKVIPDMYDIIAGSVRMDAIYGTPLIQIERDLMPQWQVVVKRGADIVLSALALLVLSPIYLLTVMAVKWDSPGPAFYRQERIGKGGLPFDIIKFRSMFVDAEEAGPALSSDHDPRITRVGRFMRKVRLDETPQFYNVLLGEMSLVGPRPERQYFIDQIVRTAPHYTHLLKVRPGITSWGMVKYGYAENVEQMVRRMKYDLLYIENMSLLVDLKILIYTVLTVLQGRGK